VDTRATGCITQQLNYYEDDDDDYDNARNRRRRTRRGSYFLTFCAGLFAIATLSGGGTGHLQDRWVLSFGWKVNSASNGGREAVFVCFSEYLLSFSRALSCAWCCLLLTELTLQVVTMYTARSINIFHFRPPNVFFCLLLLIFNWTASGFLPGGSITTIRHSTQKYTSHKITYRAQTKQST
jgi:hypothetical protein